MVIFTGPGKALDQGGSSKCTDIIVVTKLNIEPDSIPLEGGVVGEGTLLYYNIASSFAL